MFLSSSLHCHFLLRLTLMLRSLPLHTTGSHSRVTELSLTLFFSLFLFVSLFLIYLAFISPTRLHYPLFDVIIFTPGLSLHPFLTFLILSISSLFFHLQGFYFTPYERTLGGLHFVVSTLLFTSSFPPPPSIHPFLLHILHLPNLQLSSHPWSTEVCK